MEKERWKQEVMDAFHRKYPLSTVNTSRDSQLKELLETHWEFLQEQNAFETSSPFFHGLGVLLILEIMNTPLVAQFGLASLTYFIILMLKLHFKQKMAPVGKLTTTEASRLINATTMEGFFIAVQRINLNIKLSKWNNVLIHVINIGIWLNISVILSVMGLDVKKIKFITLGFSFGLNLLASVSGLKKFSVGKVQGIWQNETPYRETEELSGIELHLA